LAEFFGTSEGAWTVPHVHRGFDGRRAFGKHHLLQMGGARTHYSSGVHDRTSSDTGKAEEWAAPAAHVSSTRIAPRLHQRDP
jgi:hypothetical protein